MIGFTELAPVERARRIANSLLALLPAHERAIWAARAQALGETWLGASMIVYTDDQAITTQEAAQLLCVSEDNIRDWARRAHPERPGRMLLPRAGLVGRQQTYLVRNLLDASAAVRRRLRPFQPDQGPGAADQHEPDHEPGAAPDQLGGQAVGHEPDSDGDQRSNVLPHGAKGVRSAS
jgi:hypothetical protein